MVEIYKIVRQEQLKCVFAESESLNEPMILLSVLHKLTLMLKPGRTLMNIAITISAAHVDVIAATPIKGKINVLNLW